jgi:1-acyl-sn-glycerol-3-phosphate acyltransferase
MLPTVEPVYGLARALLTPPLRHGLRWTVEGAHLIPVRGPVILASNHVSYLDPLVLAYVAKDRGRRVRFLTKSELFGHRLLGPLLRATHQIPVQRQTAGAAASLDAAERALEQGECVVIFPEGTISLDLDPMPGKSGAARLAQTTGVKVTPVGLWGAQRILFKGRKPSWRAGVAECVVVGKPVRVGAGDDVAEATDRIMHGIAGAVARARELYPQHPARDEDDWWARTPNSAFRHVGHATGNAL